MDQLSTLTSLTVSSQPELAILCNDVLARLNFRNWVCTSGREAAEELRRRNFDLVIVEGPNSDVVLHSTPAAIGASTVGRRPTIVNIVDALPASAECSTKAGDYYIDKPVHFDRLATVIRSARNLVMREQRLF